MENKKLRIKRIIQIAIMLLLAVFIVLTVINVRLQEGTARVINYAGIARGATQRLVKLEIAGTVNSELESNLDVILQELQNGGQVNNLVKIDDKEYQACLSKQINSWKLLKEQIAITRSQGYKASNILTVSEVYFTLSDTTVSAAEKYCDGIMEKSAICEYGMIGSILILIFVSLDAFFLSKRLTKAKELKIRQQAEQDEVTGILNRRSFDRLYDFYENSNKPFALHIIDIDNFKHFNDAYGHSMGDRVLKKVAKSLVTNYRGNDYVCRIGGDEFVVLMMNMPSSLKDVAERKLLLLQSYLNNTKDDVPPITISVGVAFSDNVPRSTTLFDAADATLYKVKAKGRDGYMFYEA